jgi:hypothetical protein
MTIRNRATGGQGVYTYTPYTPSAQVLAQAAEHPTMIVTATWSRRHGHWVLVGTCPLCGHGHSHGGGTGTTPSLGHRVGHCRQPGAAAGYLLALPERVSTRAH